jgi:hypothetical protein
VIRAVQHLLATAIRSTCKKLPIPQLPMELPLNNIIHYYWQKLMIWKKLKLIYRDGRRIGDKCASLREINLENITIKYYK